MSGKKFTITAVATVALYSQPNCLAMAMSLACLLGEPSLDVWLVDMMSFCGLKLIDKHHQFVRDSKMVEYARMMKKKRTVYPDLL